MADVPVLSKVQRRTRRAGLVRQFLRRVFEMGVSSQVAILVTVLGLRELHLTSKHADTTDCNWY